ncbi:MAG: peptidyl-prolyl cis-trans isomerase [Bauldia sp.]|nr:peptidyl-prolyl cis-trans isomerase [Bauldia sp.]
MARDPLAHFMVLGAVMFGVYQLLQPETDRAGAPTEIRLTVDDLAQLVIGFEAQWNRPPTQDEFNAVLEDRVRQDILYREALALGLDKEDTIVKRRMAQKMQFLAEDVAAAREPTDDELRAWFADNGELFAMPARVSFRHLYFSPDRRGAEARADAAEALGALETRPVLVSAASPPGDPFMFRDYYAERAIPAIARDFGPDFAQAVAALPPGSWQGPVQSGYGWHLVYVEAVVPGRIPEFGEIANEVKTAWLGERKAEAWRDAYEEMRARYTIVLPVAADEATAVVLDAAGEPPPTGSDP